jgi:hypothetical protein
MVLVLLCWLVAPTTGNIQEPVWLLRQYPSSFDASRAYEMTREYVTRYPRRVMGSFEARQSTGFLKQHLESLGYRITYLDFDATVAGLRQPVGRNVLAFKAGSIPEIIAILAHYDTTRTTFQGAMDDGSGVGVLLELARAFSAEPNHRSLLIVATDGEEWGMLGARDLVRNYPERTRIVSALSLDFVAIGKLASLRLDTVGQMSGYTPPWFRQISRLCGEAESIPVYEPYGLREHVERAFLISETDQGPFLDAGIPAINLGSESGDPAREWAIYHSPQDTIDNLDVSSVDIYGRTAEQIVRTLDGLQTIPRESMGSFRLRDLVYLSARSMSILHWLTFVPLVLVLLFHWVNCKKYLTLQRAARELLALGCTVLPFLAAYYSIVLLRLLRVLPRYTLYPGTLKDPVLEHPSWGVLGGISGVFLVTAAICYLVVRFVSRKMSRPDFYVSKVVLLAALLALSFFALLYNAYWAVTFIALPVWVWMLIGMSRGAGGRVANCLMVIVAGMPYFMVEVLSSIRLGLGWKLAWYQLLALSTGMFTLTAFLLASGTIGVGVRFMAIQSQSRAG